jgi:hypothetical protein
MIDDESPADFAHENAEPATDESPREDSAPQDAIAGAAKPRRRRTTSARKKQTTIDSAAIDSADTDTSASEVDAPPSPLVEPDTDIPSSNKPAAATPRKRTPRKKTSSPQIEIVSDNPISEASAIKAPEALAPDTENMLTTADFASEDKPKRRRSARKKNAVSKSDDTGEIHAPTLEEQESASSPHPEEVVLENQPSLDILSEGDSITGIQPAKTSRRRNPRKSRRKNAAAEITEAEQSEQTYTEPVIETISRIESTTEEQGDIDSETSRTAPPAEPISRRRRSSRSRKQEKPKEEVREESLKGARLVTRHGIAEIQINGVTYPPVFFFGNLDTSPDSRRVVSQIKKAASAGVHIHSTIIELPSPLPPEGTFYETTDERIRLLLDADPNGYVIPRIVFLPAPGWRKQYPNEIIHYADGSTGDPSIASDRFWQEAESAIIALAEHIQRSNYGEKVAGFHLERGEWFHPVENGYDLSFANREAFRTWLRNKYRNSEASLRAAWYDDQVQFYTVEIPPMPTSVRPERTFFDRRKEQRWVDFLEYTSDITAERLISLGKAVKLITENRALVSVCYGYSFEFTHTFSGHLALGKLLSSQAIDIVSGPPSYKDRRAGEAGSYPIPVDSPIAHGKLWVSEDDTRTHLAPPGNSEDDYNPKMENQDSTYQVHKRAISKALVHHTGISWMDLWGEGWLDSDDIWKNIGQFVNKYKEQIKNHRQFIPEVVVLMDEKSLVHIQKGVQFLRKLLISQKEVFQRAGVSSGYYLQNDLTARHFPTDAKLYIFLNPYRLTAEQRTAVREKLKNNGKVLLWMYAPGVFDDGISVDDRSNDITGFPLRLQSWGMEIGSRFLDIKHPLIDRIQGKAIGEKERLIPSFFVEPEDEIIVLGEYIQSGLPSIAVRPFKEWTSVFSGEPYLSRDLLRNLCKFAKVHQFLQSDDFVNVGGGWLTIHTRQEGNRTLFLPASTALYDLNEEHLISENIREYSCFMKSKCNYTFFYGSMDEMRKMGFQNLAPAAKKNNSYSISQETKKGELLAIHEGISGGASSFLPQALSDPNLPIEISLTEKELAWIEEALMEEQSREIIEGDDPGLDIAEDILPEQALMLEEDDVTAVPVIAHKRRRRRGGRGRGKKTNGSDQTPPA